MAVSKVIYGSNTLIDLTGDTVVKEKLLKGYTAHGADGEPITGDCDFDANTSDATAAESEILSGKTAYVKGSKKTGAMKNNGGVTGTISDKTAQYSIPQGYHDGSGKVGIAQTEQAKIIPANIREGITLLGITGTMSGSEDVKAMSVSVFPTIDGQEILPSAGYTHLSSVSIHPIPYEQTENSAGGTTVIIGQHPDND